MMSLMIGGCLAGSLLVGCEQVEKGPLTLAERDHAARYAIVVPGGAEPSRQYAAEELRDYLAQITGARLSIVTNATPARGIYLDRGGTDLGDEAFRLQAKGRDLHIVGGKRGILYGVYEILERFGGVGWFSSWRTTVPKADRFCVPETLDETQRPAFALRSSTMRDLRDHPEFTARLRINSFPTDAKYGGQAYAFVKGLGYGHTFETLVPQERYFKTHPEYYSEVNGVRRHGQTQLCLTNPDVLEIVVSNVCAAIARDPKAEMVGVSPNDWAYYCECPTCRRIDEAEGTHAGALFWFINKVAERVTAKYPKMYVQTLAYQYSRKPPKTLKLHPAVVPCLSDIECDFSRPLADGSKKPNKAFAEDIRGWAKLTDKLFIWSYTTNYRYHYHPYPDVPTLQPNIRFFRDNHVKFLMEEGSGVNCDYGEFKAYLISKWMWNPELDFDALAEKFVAGHYGAAAPHAREYLRRYLKCCERDTKVHQGCFAFDDPKLFDDEFVTWARTNWEKAEKAVKDDPGALYSVQRAELSILVQQLDRWAATCPRAWATHHPERFELPCAAESTRLRLQELVDAVQRRKGIFDLGNLKVRRDLPRRNWKAMGRMKRPTGPTDRALITHAEFDNWNETRGDEASAPDSISADKRAIKVYNYANAPCVYFNLANLAFDPGVPYKVRLRAKIERRPGGKGEAFWARLGPHELAVRAEDVKDDGFAWYDLCTTKLTPQMQFQFANGRYAKGGGRMAVEATWIDALEFTRMK